MLIWWKWGLIHDLIVIVNDHTTYTELAGDILEVNLVRYLSVYMVLSLYGCNWSFNCTLYMNPYVCNLSWKLPKNHNFQKLAKNFWDLWFYFVEATSSGTRWYVNTYKTSIYFVPQNYLNVYIIIKGLPGNRYDYLHQERHSLIMQDKSGCKQGEVTYDLTITDK